MALTGEQEQAAALVAADMLTDSQILERLTVKSRQTLLNWKQRPEFKARVDQLRAEIRARVRSRGIAVIENRVQALQDRWERMQAVIAARAADETMKGAGHATGLLVRKYKIFGSGQTAQILEEYEVDTGLLHELREHERQAAQELGQWLEKAEVTNRGTVTIRTITAVKPQMPAPSNDGER